MAERSRDRSSSAESQPKFPGCSHFWRRNDNHFCCQQCWLNEGLTLCTQDKPCLVCKDWLPEAWAAQAKANAQKTWRKAAAAAKSAKKASERETMDGSVEIHAPEEALNNSLPNRPVTAQRTARPQLIHLTAQLFSLMTRRGRTTQHVIRRWEWTGRQAMEPRQEPRQRVDQTPQYWQGQAVRFSHQYRPPSTRQHWSTFMSMWTLLQRRMDQGMVPDTSASLAVQSSVPAPRHDSTPRRSDTQSRTPERRPSKPCTCHQASPEASRAQDQHESDVIQEDGF